MPAASSSAIRSRRCDRRDFRRRSNDRAVQVLVMVGNRSDVVLQRPDRGGAYARNEDRSDEQRLR